MLSWCQGHAPDSVSWQGLHFVVSYLYLYLYPSVSHDYADITSSQHAPWFVLPGTMMRSEVEDVKPFLWPEELGVGYIHFSVSTVNTGTHTVVLCFLIPEDALNTCMNVFSVSSRERAVVQYHKNLLWWYSVRWTSLSGFSRVSWRPMGVMDTAGAGGIGTREED